MNVSISLPNLNPFDEEDFPLEGCFHSSYTGHSQSISEFSHIINLANYDGQALESSYATGEVEIGCEG
jgi:hypothetical protein